jgi:hypothetical protein
MFIVTILIENGIIREYSLGNNRLTDKLITIPWASLIIDCVTFFENTKQTK